MTQVKLVETDCYLCGSNSKKELISTSVNDKWLALVDPDMNKVPRVWYQCNDCGFVYRSPRLNSAGLDLMYERYDVGALADGNGDAYFDKIISLSPSKSENYEKSQWLKQILQNQAGWKEDDFSSANILDVGCGGGTLLYTLGGVFDSPNRYGVELNPIYAKLAASRSGAKVTQGEYRSGLYSKKFDVVMNLKVLEHIEDPIPFVSTMVEDLDSKGVLFIEVPDVSEFERLSPDDDRFAAPHLYFFGSDTLAEVFRRCGLKDIFSEVVIGATGRAYLRVVGIKSS